jgi:acyl-CoA synthetase (AMP-forming)/AMP-acid ligase II
MGESDEQLKANLKLTSFSVSLSTLLLPTFAFGATLILPASYQFHLETYLRLVTKYKATLMHIAPPVAVTLQSTPLLDPNHPSSAGIDLSSVRTMLSGGAPTPTEVIKAIFRRTGKVLQIGYGATECGSNMHSAAQDLAEGNIAAMEELGSVGGPFGNLQVVIQPLADLSEEEKAAKAKAFAELCDLKSKAGECVPVRPCAQGEICLKGPHVMLGYYSGQGSDQPAGARDEGLTRGALTSDGQYYRTGDEGVLDYRGRLWITGRIKELIKIKGFQVPPAELDALFAKHPEVHEAAASGIIEGNTGEQIVMYVVPRDKDIATAHDKQLALTSDLAEFVKTRAAQ